MAPDQEKEAYRELCGSTPSLSLFHQPWWLDAACGPANWEAALARNPESGEVEAALPYAFRSRFGVRIIAPPPLTPFMGPVLFPPTGLNRFKKRAFEEQVIHRLLEQLPRLPVVRLKLHYDMQNWLPFRQAGFRQETMYSYRLAGLSDTSLAWNGFHPKLRNKINHAAQHCKVEQVEDAGPVFRLFEKSFRRKGQRNPVNADWFTGIGRALQERKAQAAFLCRGKDGEPLAGAYIAWDEQSAYLLMSGFDSRANLRGATALAVWASIQFAINRGLTYDFEGSMLPGVERFFREFGGELCPYHHLTRYRNRLWEVVDVWKSVKSVKV